MLVTIRANYLFLVDYFVNESLFKTIDFETCSMCNRFCSTCIRNSHPDREVVRSFFEPNYLDVEIIKDALDQVVELGFTGGVHLSHYNEPLMDERIADIARLARSYGQFKYVALNTNGDFLTEELAQSLDGVLNHLIISLYMKEPKKSERAEWIRGLFHTTDVRIVTQSDHIATHFSPAFDMEALIEQNINHDCPDPRMRVIINHRRQYLLCCDDVVGNFDLGTFPEISIKDYWFGEKHVNIVNNLRNKGGRLSYEYCTTCPRP